MQQGVQEHQVLRRGSTTSMEDKNPWNGSEKPSFHILNLSNIQTLHNMHFSNHLDTATYPPFPPSKQCWDEETLLG